MDNKPDLRDLLNSWPYDPEDDVHLVTAPDGRALMQVRSPLGIEQYELKGRPDGACPHGKESVLDYHLERLAEAEKQDNARPFVLTEDECAELFNEGTLYYYRYIHLFQVKDWEGTLRDTARNLQLFDLVHGHAEEKDDQWYLEQWRPYLLRMNAAAAAMLRLDQGHHGEALEIIEAALAKIETLEDLDDETFQFERERSLDALHEMAARIEESKPVSELESLERALREAIDTQHFEHAADLRDRIRALRNRSNPQAP